MYEPCKLPMLGASIFALDLLYTTGSGFIAKIVNWVTCSLMNVSAFFGSVSLASDIIRRPASPPSRRPSSTSTAIPTFCARSM